MSVGSQSGFSDLFRFGVFELDLKAGELRKNGRKLRLEGQPLRILGLLLEKPGEIVTREELKQKLWAEDTFVDFEHGINTSIRRLREALDDSAETPRFIETVPRRGYRFICPVDGDTAHRNSPSGTNGWRSTRLFGLMAALVVVAVASWIVIRGRATKAAAGVPIRSIAVLPLKNLSDDPRQEYLADGMTDALITELGKIGALRVISLQSVLHYKNSPKTLPEIARELQVDAVVEGAVVRSGSQIRIDAQLVEVNPERHLWADSFVGHASDVLQLQSGVAAAVAQGAQVAVTPEQRTRIAQNRHVNPEAYNAWLLGRLMYSRFDDEWFDEAVADLQKAIQLDPSFAPPYATLAEVYCTDMRFPYAQRYQMAQAAAAKALELDGSLAEAHAAQGYVDLRFQWDWPAAEREFERSLELNPNSSEALSAYGYFLMLMGRFDEGIASYRHAIEVDPVSFLPNERLGWAYTIARRDEEAITQLQNLARREPTMFMTSYSLVRAYAFKKMYREAMRALRRGHRPADANAQPSDFDYGWVIAVAGNRTEAEQLIQRMIQYSQKRYLDPCYIAFTYAGLGETDKALQWLEKGYEQHARFMIYLKVIRDVDNLRSDPRFQELLRRMNFPRQQDVGPSHS